MKKSVVGKFLGCILSISFVLGCEEQDIQIDIPTLNIVDPQDSNGDDPALMGFSWISNFARTDQDGVLEIDPGTTHTVFASEGGASPRMLARDRKNSRPVLLPEDIAQASLHFPRAADNLEQSEAFGVAIGGVTLCGIDIDDGRRRAAFKRAVAGVGRVLDSSLRGSVGHRLFTIENARDALVESLNRMRLVALQEFRQIHDPSVAEEQAAANSINAAIDETIDGVIAEKANVGAIVGGVLEGVGKVASFLVGLFDSKPNPDDLMGCGSVILVSTTENLWNHVNNGGSTCSLGGEGLPVSVCSIEQFQRLQRIGTPPRITFELPDSNASVYWLANPKVRKATKRRLATTKTFGMTGSDVVNVIAPRLDPEPEGREPIDFIELVDYRTNGADTFSFTVTPPVGDRLFTVGSYGDWRGSTTFKINTLYLPPYVKVDRRTIRLETKHNGCVYPPTAVPEDSRELFFYHALNEEGTLIFEILHYKDIDPDASWSMGEERISATQSKATVSLIGLCGELDVRITQLSWPTDSPGKYMSFYARAYEQDQQVPGVSRLGNIDMTPVGGFADAIIAAPIEYRQQWDNDFAFSSRLEGGLVEDENAPVIFEVQTDHAPDGGAVEVVRFKGWALRFD